MSDKITKTDDDYLADIIWWIKGYIAANKLSDNIDYDGLGEDHIRAIKKYRLAHLSDIKEEAKMTVAMKSPFGDPFTGKQDTQMASEASEPLAQKDRGYVRKSEVIYILETEAKNRPNISLSFILDLISQINALHI